MTTLGANSTTKDVLVGVDLTGKRALVTGVSAGLGIETVRALLAHGAQVIGVVCDLERARCATHDLSDQFGERFSLVEADLSSLTSVRRCADGIRASVDRLDIVIANAGIMATPFTRTDDGFESQFGINHLGHFVLANRLAPLLPAGGRVVVLSSSAHMFSDVDLDDPNYDEKPYDAALAYGASKTASALFAVEFDRRHGGRGVRAVAAHPGEIPTELARHLTPEVMAGMIALSAAQSGTTGSASYKTIPQGAATSVWAAIAPAELVGGKYTPDCQVANLAETGAGVRPYAIDPVRAQQLWTVSERLVREDF